MNSTDKVTYEFILSLAQKYKNVSNEQISKLINKYQNKGSLSFSEKKTLLITEFKNRIEYFDAITSAESYVSQGLDIPEAL